MEQSWLQENANQLVHYRDKIGVCNVICFCQCQKHESISILLVKPRDKQSKNFKHSMFVLPGGKRDFRTFRQTEPCWDAVVREFQEEVDEDLNDFCKKKCRFFEESIQVGLDIGMVTDNALKDIIQTNQCKYINNSEILHIENRHIDDLPPLVPLLSSQALEVLKTPKEPQVIDFTGEIDFLEQDQGALSSQTISDVNYHYTIEDTIDQQESQDIIPNGVSLENSKQSGSTQITRRIRSYFVEIDCSDIPDKKFGRFNLYEMTERKWFPLETMITQFKEQHRIDKHDMIISPKLFRCISIFGGKLVHIQQKQLQKLNFVYQHNALTIDDETDPIMEQTVKQPQDFLNGLIQRIQKTHSLFAKINNSIKKQPIVVKIGSDVLYL